jgi:uncharacterized protein YjiS (DUF1127 family)
MNFRNKLSQMLQYHRTVRELSALDARQLRDLGITRADIHDIARGKAL